MTIIDHLGGRGGPVDQGPHAAAIEHLFHSVAPDVRRFVRTRVDAHEVDDIVAEVFGAACAAVRKERAIDAAWLMAVARNKVVDHWRRGGRRRELETTLRNHAVVASRPQTDVAPTTDEVRQTLGELSSRHRHLLELRYVADMSVREMAQTVGQTERCVESALARSRRAFRTRWSVPAATPEADGNG